ncbi:MAG: hypothetical protein M1817_000286 [Caeruleum heppii]|nr:MAG: hypothetical protein M1817_000286 [Caeruleum heppii]
MRTFAQYLALTLALRGSTASHFEAAPAPPLLNDLVRRDFVSCAEAIGASPVACAASTCGGEDAANAGHCLNENAQGGHCQCNKDGEAPAAPVLSTVTATQDGQTVVGTFALETLPAYADLRQSITTTLLSTSTATDGATVVETAAAVVMAGGVAWILAGYVGDAAIAEAVLEAPKEAGEDHQDDKSCPTPQKACSDCGGKEGMCTTGDATGCVCEEKGCPESPPPCDEACAAKDGKCTAGDNNGCDCNAECPAKDQMPQCVDEDCKGGEDKRCTANNAGCECTSCPTYEETLFCEDCGGGSEEKCKGNPEKNGENKDCPCIEVGERTNFGYVPAGAIIGTWGSDFSGLPDITDASYSLDPGSQSCQRAGWSAPQRDENGSPSVTSKIDEWCASQDGKDLTKSPKGVDTLFAMYKVSYYSFWLSASSWYFAPEGNQCGDTAKISKDECVDTLTKAMQVCDPNSGQTSGASLFGKCINYNITLSDGTNPDSPPWNPLPASAGPGCEGKDPSGVPANFFAGLYPQFCSAVGEKSDQPLSKTLTNRDFKAPSEKRGVKGGSLKSRAPPATGNSYTEFEFKFEWSGGSGDCSEDCNEAYHALKQSPCGQTGGKQSDMASSGSIDVGCGQYSYSIDKPAPPHLCKPNEMPTSGLGCEAEEDGCGSTAVNPQGAYAAAADQFCNGGDQWIAKADDDGLSAANYYWFDTNNPNPDTKLAAFCGSGPSPTGGKSAAPASAQYCKSQNSGVLNSNSKIYVQVSPSADQKDCSPLAEHRLPTGEDCTRMFKDVVDECAADGSQGTGGFATEKSRDGCWDWWMWGGTPL